MKILKRALPPLGMLCFTILGFSLWMGCSAIASHEEYAAYRRVRLAHDERTRLIAMQEYVAANPNGIWAGSIQAERESREDMVWQASNASRDGLEFYMQAYPEGRFAAQARPRLAALQTVNSRREQEQDRVQELRREQSAQTAEQRRTWVFRAVTFWTRTLVGIRNYGSSISQVARGNPEFAEAFGQDPPPDCNRERCIKHYTQAYHIPVPGSTRIDRQMHVFLRINLDQGRVERTELLLPNKGFSRWYEMENRELVTDEDPAQRQAAINWAFERIQPILVEVAQGARPTDFVPEPINPIRLTAPEGGEQPAEGGTSGGEASGGGGGGDTEMTFDESETHAAPAQQGSGLDSLLNAAAGGGQQQQQPHNQPAAEEPMETLVLPVGVVALRFRNVRVVVFAAGDDDYGTGYDGVFIERVRGND